MGSIEGFHVFKSYHLIFDVGLENTKSFLTLSNGSAWRAPKNSVEHVAFTISVMKVSKYSYLICERFLFNV